MVQWSTTRYISTSHATRESDTWMERLSVPQQFRTTMDSPTRQLSSATQGRDGQRGNPKLKTDLTAANGGKGRMRDVRSGINSNKPNSAIGSYQNVGSGN
eukprot:3507965-Rhodomonas_salina.2